MSWNKFTFIDGELKIVFDDSQKIIEAENGEDNRNETKNETNDHLVNLAHKDLTNILNNLNFNLLIGAGINKPILDTTDDFEEIIENVKFWLKKYKTNWDDKKNLEGNINTFFDLIKKERHLDDEMLAWLDKYTLEGEKKFVDIDKIYQDTLNEAFKKKEFESFIKSWNRIIEHFLIDKLSINEEIINRAQKTDIGALVRILKAIDKSSRGLKNVSELLALNIWSLNYDNLLLELFRRNGIFSHTIEHFEYESKEIDMLNYDVLKGKLVPTFKYIKLHGGLNNMILPTYNKYETIMELDDKGELGYINRYFGLYMMFKDQLIRKKYSSFLICIGYSAKDSHINQVIKQFVNEGNKLIFFSYKEEDSKSLKDIFDKENNINTNQIYEFCSYLDERNPNPKIMLANLLSSVYNIELEDIESTDKNSLNKIEEENENG